ncbi:hypothetical protein JKF63_03465 [Porcisia hertigi]|uniref:carbonic anhydrase n=1 Tax=Porcisia hertigi TaxID=2761500 RepID=A0A836IGW4_9TRYP|nr:hypothetical protein JKF63_03465 [Porcisia hertigi]
MTTVPLRVTLPIVQVLLLVGIAVVAFGLDEQHSYHEGNYGISGLPRRTFDESAASWSYTNLSDWPELCLKGSRQSPISFENVNPDEVMTNDSLQRLQFSPECVFPREKTQMRIINEGVVNTVTFETQGRLLEDMSPCTLRDPLNRSQFYHFTGLNFHVTSEHHLRTLRPDAEMQMFFTTDDSPEQKRRLLVVAVMLKGTSEINSTSARALRHILVDGSLPKPRAMTTCFLTEDLPIRSLIPARQSYLLYDGSQTSPPCTENVRWVVMTSPILLSRVALGRLRDAMDELMPNEFARFGNARPPQALNSRLIYRFDDTSVPAGGNRKEGYLGDAWSRKNKSLATLSRGSKDVDAETALFRVEDPIDDDSSDPIAQPLGPVFSGNGTENSTLSPVTLAAGCSDGSSGQPAENSTTKEEAWSSPPHENGRSQGKNVLGNSTHDETLNAITNSTTVPQVKDPASASSSASFPSHESSNQESSHHRTPHSSTLTTSTTTTTTKKPLDTPPKKGHDSRAHKNTSTTVKQDANSFESRAVRTWVYVKSLSVGAFHYSSAYAKAHPGRAGLVLVLFTALIFLICTCCRGWRRPLYVVGIDPAELQPLKPANRFKLYGGTGTAAVRPADVTVDAKSQRGAAVF